MKKLPVGRSRCVGWYKDLNIAQKCVIEDWADFDEANYFNYIVIEENSEGLYNPCVFDIDNQTEWWYKYDHVNDKWFSIDKPKWSNNITGWGMG